MSNLVWPIIISTLVSFVLTYLVKQYALKHHLAMPIRARDVHTKQIPRLGGLAIFGAFLIVVIIYQVASQNNFSGFGFPFAIFGISIDKRLLAVLIASVVLVATMAYDDIKGLKPYQKLSAQILVALIIIAGGIGIRYINNPFGGLEFRLDQWQIPVQIGAATYHFVVLADLLAVAWLLLLMNVVNFSDGVDGLAGTMTAIALLVLMLLSLRDPVNQPATALLSSIGFGAVLGFLFWNWPPAKIFMGDSGAMFLGFLIGVIGLIAGGKIATILVVLALPILDALLVIFTRLIHGYNPLTHPDQSHLHHRFLHANFSARQTLTVLGVFCATFGIIALKYTGLVKAEMFGIAVIALVIIIIALSAKSRNDNSKLSSAN
ncbi:MAG: MraY family glycosyltransferase [Patescibacteria group bacterium]|jgi:UDP-GlcNAc:undecaprenyl-phosphate GlcNAc-1-phosphate transferase